MPASNAQASLIGIFHEALSVPPEWDSIGRIVLVAAIEGGFDIMPEADQVIDMGSFERACEILASHGVDIAT